MKTFSVFPTMLDTQSAIVRCVLFLQANSCISLSKFSFRDSWLSCCFMPGVGNLRPAGRIQPRQGKASGPQHLHQIVVTVWPTYNGTVLYFINLPSLQLIVWILTRNYLWQGFSNFFVLQPIFKKFFLGDPLMDSPDVNDTCKRPIS